MAYNIGPLSSVNGTITNSQAKALHGTPITVIAAQGSGTIIIPVSSTLKLNYGGNNAFTAPVGSSFIILAYATSLFNAYAYGVSQSTVQSTNSEIFQGTPGSLRAINTSFEGLAVQMYNNSATELAGNAANDNTFTYNILYYVIKI